MMAKVSFILPAYKRRFLKEAMASILAQTYRDFELVAVLRLEQRAPDFMFRRIGDGIKNEPGVVF